MDTDKNLNEYYMESLGSPPFRRHYIFAKGGAQILNGYDFEVIHKFCLCLNSAYRKGLRDAKANAKQ